MHASFFESWCWFYFCYIFGGHFFPLFLYLLFPRNLLICLLKFFSFDEHRKMVKLFSTSELIPWPLPAELMSDVSETSAIWDDNFNSQLHVDLRKRVVEHVMKLAVPPFHSPTIPTFILFSVFQFRILIRIDFFPNTEHSSDQQILQSHPK
jgi:hypothetical protein